MHIKDTRHTSDYIKVGRGDIPHPGGLMEYNGLLYVTSLDNKNVVTFDLDNNYEKNILISGLKDKPEGISIIDCKNNY